MKKFDWKKLLVLVLVLALCVTMFAACKPGDEGEGGGEGDGGTPGGGTTDSNIKPQAKKEHFFDTMFTAADQIGKNSVTVADDAVYIKLGVGLDLATGGNSVTSQSEDALKLLIGVEAIVDTSADNIDLAQHKDGNFDEDGKLIDKSEVDEANRYRFVPNADNTSAAKVVIKAGSVDLISLYYDMEDANGIVYAMLGGNKVAVDVSDVDADITNVEAIVLDAIASVINNAIVSKIAGAFGDNFTLNGFLNTLLAELGLDLAELLQGGTVGGIVEGVLGVDDINVFFDDEGGLLLGDVLATAGPLLFKTPVWTDASGNVIPSTTALPAVAGVACTGEIGLDLLSDSLSSITGSIDLIANATLALGFTKTADDKMDSFYIDAKIAKLGADEDRALALRITIADLVISNDTDEFEKLDADDKAEYVAPAFDIDLEITLPDEAVQILLGEDASLMIPNANPAAGELYIPAYIGLEVQGKIDFCHAANTAANVTLMIGADKAHAVAGAKAQLFYDSTAGYGVAEVEVLEAGQPTYTTVKTLITQFAKLTKWGWYEEDGSDTVTYENVNAALTEFQETGKLKVTGIDVYKLIWPGDGNGVYTYDNTPAAEATAANAVAELDFMSTKSGLIAAIAQLIEIDIEGNKISIGCDDTMKFLFSDNLFTIKDDSAVTLADLCAIWSLNDEWIKNNSQSFYQEGGENLIEGISINSEGQFVATKSVYNANKAGAKAEDSGYIIPWKLVKTEGQTYIVDYAEKADVTLETAAKCWEETLTGINAVIGEGGKVDELTVEDIENADVGIDLTWEDEDGILSEIALEIKVAYPGVTTPVSIKLTAQMKDPEDLTFGTTSYFEAEEDFGLLELTIRNKETGEQVFPAVAA